MFLKNAKDLHIPYKDTKKLFTYVLQLSSINRRNSSYICNINVQTIMNIFP